MPVTRVFVTGGTGHVGGALLSLLRDDPRFEAIALTRHEPPTVDDGVRWVHGDLADPGDVARAATGCDAAFLVWPFGDATAAPPVLDALATTVGHVVYLSSAGVRDDLGPAGDPITAFHTAIERGLGTREVRTTALRSGGMATNTLGWAGQIRASGTVRWAFGDLARPLVHEADLADVAALALGGDPAVAGRASRLTGPALVSQQEQVELLGAALGRDIRWQNEPPAATREHLLADGWPRSAADGALAAWAAMRDDPEPVTDVERFTGRRGRPFARWARDHVEDFR